MSMMHCHRCDHTFDSDYHDACPLCDDYEPNPLKAYAFELADKDWRAEMVRHTKLIEERHYNALSDNFAYTNGSDERYRKAIAASAKRREALFKAMLYLA